MYKTVILTVVMYWCKTWSPTLMEECRLTVLENMVLRRICGTKMEKVIGRWRKLHN